MGSRRRYHCHGWSFCAALCRLETLTSMNSLGRGRGESRHVGEEWRDLERHLLLGREESNRSNLHHLQMIAPRVELDPAAERQCRDLLNALHFQWRRRTGERRQASSLSIPEGVAQVRLDEAGKLRRAILQCFQEQTGVTEFVLIWGVGQQIHRFLIRSLFICGAASEVQALERIYIGEKETVGECQLGVDAMTKRDMPKLMGQHHSQ